MAFQDLRDGIADLFDDSGRADDAATKWSNEYRRWASVRRQGAKRDRLLDDRLRRKLARARADRRMPSPLPRDVGCVFCREEFRTAHGLECHLAQVHRTRFGKTATCSCRHCREELHPRDLGLHLLHRHPVEYAQYRSTVARIRQARPRTDKQLGKWVLVLVPESSLKTG